MSQAFLNENDDDYEGLVQLEFWETVKIFPETTDNPYAGRNNLLLQPWVLEQIFIHLTDLENIRSSRLVCHTWRNTLKDTRHLPHQVAIGRIGSGGGTDTFITLMSNPHAQLPLQSLTLRCAQMESESVVQLFSTYGPLLKELTLWMIDLTSLTFLWLPIWCPNLRKLTFQLKSARMYGSDLSKSIQLSPSFLREAWISPFPYLKELTVSEVLNPFQGGHEVGQFLLTALERCGGIERLRLSDNWNIFLPKMSKLPKSLSQLKRLSLKVHPRQFDYWHWKHVEMTELKYFKITPSGRRLSEDCSSEGFNTFLRGVPNLLTLVMQDDNFNNLQTFPVTFEREMKFLQKLALDNVPLVKAQIDSRLVNLLPQLPSLRFCNFSLDEEFKSKYEGIAFWNGLYPLKSFESDFVNRNLTYLKIDWYFEDPWIVQELSKSFPNLRALALVFDGNLLPAMIEEFKDFKIHTFSFTYYETEGGIRYFDSGMTGMSQEDCDELLKESTSRKSDIAKTYLKIGPTFADWKYLEHLHSTYKRKDSLQSNTNDESSNNSIDSDDEHLLPCVPLNRPVVWECLELMSSLKCLILRHFQMDDILALRIMKKVPLEHFYCSKIINSFNPGTQDGFDRKGGFRWSLEGRFSNVEQYFL